MTSLPFSRTNFSPLANRMRPANIDEFVGQQHLLGTDKPFRHLIETDKVGSIILWGPPGIGKTTLARIISSVTKKRFEEISAVNAGVADIRKIIASAGTERSTLGRETILFIDEVHRFNKGQQDAVLPSIEEGTITLIGSTTENPSFQVIPALRSRCRTYKLTHLSYNEIHFILQQALKKDKGFGSKQITLEPKALETIIIHANGDARFSLNALETAVNSSSPDNDGKIRITHEQINAILQKTALAYDKMGDEHYNHASAFQKSLRGSDPDAAIYWLAKMIAGGEDPRFIGRRLLVTASEDVGNANPKALSVALAAVEAAERLGFPEARIPLSQAAIYIATSPKSNSSLLAIDKALHDIEKKGKSFPVPDHLKDSHYPDAKKYGYGKGYRYPHDYPGNYVMQTYLPKELQNTTYYRPSKNGEENNPNSPSDLR